MDAKTIQPAPLVQEARDGPLIHPLLQSLIGSLERTEETPQNSALQKVVIDTLIALQAATNRCAQTGKKPAKPNAPDRFTPLALEARSTLPTPEAAYHLTRAQQTLRLWAMRGDGPVKCVRINGRLAWPVSQIKRALGLA